MTHLRSTAHSLSDSQGSHVPRRPTLVVVQVWVRLLQENSPHCSASVSIVHATHVFVSVSHAGVSVRCSRSACSVQPVQVLGSVSDVRSQTEASVSVQSEFSRQLTHLLSGEQTWSSLQLPVSVSLHSTHA